MSNLSDDPGPTPRISRDLTDHHLSPTDFERTTSFSSAFIPGYELYEMIGEGGYGKVYKARQFKLDRLVALKIILLDSLSDPSLASRFQTEAVTLAKLHHSNIVQVYDFGQTDTHMYLAMELLEGEDLGAFLRKSGAFNELTTWHIIRQAAAGLAHAAAMGVVHRDVKPANLFLMANQAGSNLPNGVPTVKVMDFGLALVKWRVDDVNYRTAPGVAVGTPAYMAPEQHRSGAVDLRADIYALGATAYHTLVGKAPFEGRTIWDVMARKLEHTPAPIAADLEHSAKLIAAMMTPDPEKRLQSYEELIEKIDQLPVFHDQPHRSLHATRRAGPFQNWVNKNGWSRKHILQGLVAFVTTILLVTFGLVAIKGTLNPKRPSAPTRFVSKGDREALFDGISLERWAMAGNWKLEPDPEEGHMVFSGSGLIRRTFREHPHYRIVIGFDVFKAEPGEVHFGITAASSSNAPRYVLRISRTNGVVFGTKRGDKGVFQPLSEPVKFPSTDWLADRNPHLEVRVERAGGIWSAYFNGVLVGQAKDDGTPKLYEIGIRADDGRARIETVILEPLDPAS